MGHVAKMINSVETALDVAIFIEQRGRDIFTKAKDNTKDPKLMNLFSFLAAEEERHLGLYREMLNRISNDGFPQVDLVGGYGDFIRAITDDVLQSLESLGSLSPEECIGVALRFEKDNLLFFQEVKSLMTGADAEIIERICKEEKSHILRLMEFKRGFDRKS